MSDCVSPTQGDGGGGQKDADGVRAGRNRTARNKLLVVVEARGGCPMCGYRWRLRKDGAIMAHTLYAGGKPFGCKGGPCGPFVTGQERK
jgi:hypothetical protein